MPETKNPADTLADIREMLGAALQRVDAARAELACGIAPDMGTVISALETAESLLDKFEASA